MHRAYVSGGGLPARRIVETYSTASGQTARSYPLTGDFEIHMNNHGMTPAELMQIAIEFCDSAKIPLEPNYDLEPFHDWLGPGTQSRPMLWRKFQQTDQRQLFMAGSITEISLEETVRPGSSKASCRMEVLLRSWPRQPIPPTIDLAFVLIPERAQEAKQ